MKYISIVLLMLLSSATFSQKEEIYDLVFNDTANFNVASANGLNIYYISNDRKYQTPSRIVVSDSTIKWLPSSFWLNENYRSPEILKQIMADEHHPYHNCFLFKDTMLDRLIVDSEKISLSEKAAVSQPRAIRSNGVNYKTTDNSKLKGFFFITSEPLFSSDCQYAFIHIIYAYKRKKNDEADEFAFTNIIYKKNEHQIWQKYYQKGCLIF